MCNVAELSTPSISCGYPDCPHWFIALGTIDPFACTCVLLTTMSDYCPHVNSPLWLCLPTSLLQTVNTGSLRWGTINLMAYFYMVLSWGGYSFVINLIPIYVLACIVTGRVTARHYLAFAPLVFVGTLLAGRGSMRNAFFPGFCPCFQSIFISHSCTWPLEISLHCCCTRS